MVIPYVFLIDVEHRQEDVEEVAQDQSRPVVHPRLETFVEDLVEEEDRFRVEEDGTDVLVGARWPASCIRSL